MIGVRVESRDPNDQKVVMAGFLPGASALYAAEAEALLEAEDREWWKSLEYGDVTSEEAEAMTAYMTARAQVYATLAVAARPIR